MTTPLSNSLHHADISTTLHPYTDARKHEAQGPLVIDRGEGIYVYDSNGKQYIEGLAGLWSVAVGFSQPRLREAAARQMDKLPYYHTFAHKAHEPSIKLAEKLVEMTPENLTRVFYTSSGSEANDTNIRMVRTYWAEMGKPQKNIIISRKNAYHGSTLGGASLGGMGGMHAQGGLPIPDIYHIDQPNWWAEGGQTDPAEFGLERARQLEQAIEQLGEDRVAAFIAEPVQGAGGVIVPPDTYWPEIQRICNKYNILLIADEVICGFGRTGNWFGSQTVGWAPDIMTIAKGLSSGYQPIGGSIVSDKIAGVMAACEFNHGYTYNAHPVAAAVALENLTIMQEEKLVDYVSSDIGPYLKQQWEALVDHPMVGEAKIVGMMGSIALTPHKESRAKFAAEAGTVGYMVRERCFANNLVMRHVYDRMIISPPLVITRDEVDILIARARQSLDEAMAQVKEAGLWQAAS